MQKSHTILPRVQKPGVQQEARNTKPISCYVLSEVTQAKIFTLSNSLCDIFSYAVFFSRMLGQMKMILCEIILDKVWKSFNLSKTLEIF